MKYRAEIDGLRTIAVLSVIVYHATLTIAGRDVLPEGYFGVDVFFVISGFLITSLLLGELDRSGTVSILGFYERRARRLLPALLFVMLASMVGAWQILLPAQLVDFAKSLLASLFFVSNFYWDMSLQEYGAESGLIKPFLHTWSLAVEEQYYIFFPLMLAAIYRWWRPYLLHILVAMLLLSLGFAQWFTLADRHSSFYILPSRFWELLAGGVLAWYTLSRTPPDGAGLAARWLPAAGVLMLLWSFIFVDHDAHHPGLVTLVPVVGTLLIIWFANEQEVVYRVLSSRLFVGIGLISYSLYLWHYPIFALARNALPELTFLHAMALIALTFVCSIISYFVVEKPLRDRERFSVSRLALVLGPLSLLVVGFSAAVVYKDGFRERFSDLEALYGQAQFDNTILRDQSWEILTAIAKQKGFGPSKPQEPSEFEANHLWFSDNEKTRKILVVGNSKSKDLFNALYLNKDRVPDYEFARFGMFPNIRQEQVETLLASPNFQAADAIVASFLVREKVLDRYLEFLQQLRATGKPIYLTSNPQSFWSKNGKHALDLYLEGNLSGDHLDLTIGQVLYASRLLGPFGNVNEPLAAQARQWGIPFLDLLDIVCNQEKMTCDLLLADGQKGYYDSVHWTLNGARLYGERILESNWLQTPPP